MGLGPLNFYITGALVMARNLHKYEELTPWEFDQEKAHASIIYAAVGPVVYWALIHVKPTNGASMPPRSQAGSYSL